MLGGSEGKGEQESEEVEETDRRKDRQTDRVFFKSVVPGWSIMFQWKSTHPGVYPYIQKLFLMYSEREHRVGSVGKGVGCGRSCKGGTENQHTRCEIFKESFRIFENCEIKTCQAKVIRNEDSYPVKDQYTCETM